MPASKCNYLVVYESHPQVYASGTKTVALASPPPEGCELKDKHIFFITYDLDNDQVMVHQLPRDEVLNAEIKEKKKK